LSRSRTFAAGALWIVDGLTVRRFDPATNGLVATINLPRPACPVAGNDVALFVASCDTAKLWRIDPATNTLLGGLDLGYAASAADLQVGLGAV
jgi:sugar lactone lactonase YvrE